MGISKNVSRQNGEISVSRARPHWGGAVGINLVFIAIGVLTFFSSESDVSRFLIQIGLSVQFIVGVFLLQRFSGYRARIIPVSCHFFLFLNLFYTIRGWVNYIYDDNELQLSLGVLDPHLYVTRALSLVLIFSSIYLASYSVGSSVRFGSEFPHWTFKKIIFREFLVWGQGLGGVVAAVLFGLISVGVSIVVSGIFKSGGDAGAFSGYITALLFVCYGMVVGGWSYVTRAQDLALPSKVIGAFVIITCMCITAYYAREISSFRIYYLGGLILLFLSGFPKIFNVKLFLIFLIVALPLMTILGQTRGALRGYVINDVAMAARVLREDGFGKVLATPFMAEGGDFTCLDIFASALSNNQRFRPWGLSYVYPLAHVIPRSIWEGKPEDGMLDDRQSYLTLTAFNDRERMIPYTAGVVGDLYLEGYYYFIIIGAIVLGALFVWVDNQLIVASRNRVTARFVSVYSIFSLVALFSIRSVPYQVVYYFAFLFAGLLVSSLFIRSSVERDERKSSG